MKIINNSKPDRKPPDRSQFLGLEINRLHEEIGVKERIRHSLPVSLQEQYLGLLENFIAAHGTLKKLKEAAKEQRGTKDGGFTCFQSLPTELRLKIWRFAFASYLCPRVHCIDVRTSKGHKLKFMSNQPVSPLLHTNRESRAHYLFTTQMTFAFETYINFKIDTIYIPDFEDRRGSFRKFLNFEESKKIQKLALRKDLSCQIPLPGHMSMAHFEMIECPEAWRQMIVIFEDERYPKDAWQDVNMEFREFSAKEKRARAERSYARGWCKALSGMVRVVGEETAIDFRFGQFESDRDQVDSIKRLCASRVGDLE
jgi:hypothetical protein